MNTFVAKVTNITKCDSLHIVKFSCNGIEMSMMSLELNEDIKISTFVKLVVKPTHISISKNFDLKTTHENIFKVRVSKVENGELLSSIGLIFGESILEAIVTFESSQRLNFQDGDEVMALIQASELSILEIVR